MWTPVRHVSSSGRRSRHFDREGRRCSDEGMFSSLRAFTVATGQTELLVVPYRPLMPRSSQSQLAAVEQHRRDR
jgi:hypothetical protein